MTASGFTADSPPPPLPFELADPIIACTIQLLARSSLRNPTAITEPLNVLSRVHAPLATKAALMHMPHIDMNSATKLGDLGLLKLMRDWSKQTKGRPVKYAGHQVLPFALKRDSSKVLEWWLDESRLVLVWDWGCRDVMEAFCERADVMWLEWWKARGYPYLEMEQDDGESTFVQIAVHASTVGRVDILDWLLENVGAARMASANGEYARALVVASRNGHVHVLQWWFLTTQAGVFGPKVDWSGMLVVAFSEGQVSVLEWCENQPAAMEALAQPLQIDWIGAFKATFSLGHVAVLEWCQSQHVVMKAWWQVVDKCVRAGDTSALSSMCLNVVKKRLGLDWLLAFDLLPFADGSSCVSREACERGQLDLAKELHSRGSLLGSRKQLVQHSLKSGKLELLEWIQASIDPSIPDRSDWHFGYDPYDAACSVGNVYILDWLLANGFQFPPPGEKRARVFKSAAYYGRIDVLEWLFKNGFAKDMTMEDWSGSFSLASGSRHIDVLDWLADRIPTTAAPMSPIPMGMPWNVFREGLVDVIEWWMQKSGWLKDVYDLTLGQPYLQACGCDYGSGAASKAALIAWFNAGQPMDFAKCIHEASINGRIDVLDWLLRCPSASEQDFANAWSSHAFPDAITIDSIYARYRFDIDNHGKSLTWWRANLPHVAALPVNRGPYSDPIHAHYLQHMLKNTSFELLSPFEAIDEYGGCVDLLEYQKRTGQDEDFEQDADWYLEAASERGQCDVLEWFKVALGVRIKCPKAVAEGRTQITKNAKAWWARSGSEDEKVIAKTRDK